MDLEQMRHLGRGENFFHRHIPSFYSTGLPPSSQLAKMLPANLRFGTQRRNFNADHCREFLEGHECGGNFLAG